MTDPTDTPEPTREDWELSRQLCTCCPGMTHPDDCPVCAEAVEHIARYRTRLMERAADACFQIAVLYSMDAEAAGEPEDAAHHSALNDVALRCRNAVLALSTGGGETLEDDDG